MNGKKNYGLGHTMKYYLAKSNKLKEIKLRYSSSTAEMSERSQTQKDKYYIIPLIYLMLLNI